MIVTPLDSDDVFCALLDEIRDLIVEMTDVFKAAFIARTFGAVH